MNRIVAVTLFTLALVACGAPDLAGNQNAVIAPPDGGAGLVKAMDCEAPAYMDYGVTEVTYRYGYEEWTDGTVNVTCSAVMPDGTVNADAILGAYANNTECRVLIYTNDQGRNDYLTGYYDPDGTQGGWYGPGVYFSWSGSWDVGETNYPRPEGAVYADWLWPESSDGQPPMTCTPR